MPPRLRTLLILAALAVVGVSALALLAQRYRTMIPESSVRDLAPFPAVDESVPPAPAPAPPSEAAPVPPPADAPAAREETPPASPSPTPTDADRAAVAGFLEVRGAIRAFLAENRQPARKVAAELAHDPSSGQRAAVDTFFFVGFRLARREALERVGMDEPEYVRVRAAWAAWMKGEAQGGLAAALDAAGEKAREAGLRGLEPLDYDLAF